MPSKPVLLAALTELQTGLTKISKTIQNTHTASLNPDIFGQDVNEAIGVWAERIERELSKFGVEAEVCSKYKNGLRELHTLSIRWNKKEKHQRTIKELLADFQVDLVQPVMFHGGADPSEAIKQ